MRCFVFLLILTISAPAAERPSILWLTLEDTSPHFIGCYGNEAARTPNIDRLASRGVRMDRAFANAPVCSSARTTLITGTLNDALGTGNHRSTWPLPDAITGFPAFLREAGMATYNNQKTDYSTSSQDRIIRESWNESSGNAGWWKRTDDAPFFAVFNFESCHQSRTMTEPYQWYRKNVWSRLTPEERTADDAFPLPPFLADTAAIRHEFARVYNSITLADKQLGQLVARLEKDGLADDTIIFCFADHGEAMPRGKANPVGLGYRVPFIVVFPEKWSALNPWGKPGSTSDELICFDDLAPTLLSLVGKPPAPWMTGRPFLGKYRKDPRPEIFCSRQRIDESAGCARSITDGRFLYTRRFLPVPEMAPTKYFDVAGITREIRKSDAAGKLTPAQASMLRPTPHEVLYDLQRDEWEMTDLAALPEHAALKEKLRGKLFDHILATGDVMLMPEYELSQISKKGTPYETGQQMKPDRRRAILDAADLASRPEADSRLLELALSDDPIVAFWGATGIRLHPGLLPSGDELDGVTYPPARIELAAARLLRGEDAAAKQVLEEACRNPNTQISLQALQRIQDFGPAAKAFEPTLKACLKGGDLNTRSSAEVTLYLLGLGKLQY